MKSVRLTLCSAFTIFVAFASAQKVTTASLLEEMNNLSRLSTQSSMLYTTAQSSSYDRASVKEGTDDWFANGDYGKYIRSEKNGGRTEWVMADLKGPGAVVRIWSANPNGVIRFYFDGEKEARITEKTADLLTGKVKPWGEPYAYMASRGCNIYFPFPYSKSLKITVEDTDKRANGMYYHVNYRSYSPGVDVETFDPKKLGEMKLPNSLMLSDEFGKENPFTVTPPVAKSWALIEGPSEITGLKLKLEFPEVPKGAAWDDPRQKHNILRNLELQIDFDNETTVRIPVADFFLTATKANTYDTLPVSVHGNEFIARWSMPYKKQAVVKLFNHGKEWVKGSISFRTRKLDNFEGRLYFHAQWGHDYKGTRPMADMHLLMTKGRGRYVGSVLTVANPVRGWWGEGDEKVFVDGETFPSTFGTGTEDYFGYAWSSNQPFQQTYHAQPQSDGPGNFGYSVIGRWHIFDDIPFRRSIRFDIEKWHWADCPAEYSYAAFWYAAPGGAATEELDIDAIRFAEMSLKSAPKDAIEGETLKFSATGGKAEVQENIGGASDEKQIWWMDAPLGSKLNVTFTAPSAGKYRIVMGACKAVDYGAHRIFVNGVEAGVIDFYNPELTWKEFVLGEFDLNAGDNQIVVEYLGSNPASNPKRHMFGLDWLQLKPVTKG